MSSKGTDDVEKAERTADMSDADRGYARLETARRDRHSMDHSRAEPFYSDAPAAHEGSDLSRQHPSVYQQYLKRERAFWSRLKGEGRNVPGWLASGKNVVFSSCTSSVLLSSLSV